MKKTILLATVLSVFGIFGLVAAETGKEWLYAHEVTVNNKTEYNMKVIFRHTPENDSLSGKNGRDVVVPAGQEISEHNYINLTSLGGITVLLNKGGPESYEANVKFPLDQDKAEVSVPFGNRKLFVKMEKVGKTTHDRALKLEVSFLTDEKEDMKDL